MSTSYTTYSLAESLSRNEARHFPIDANNLDEVRNLISFLVGIRTLLTAEGLERLAQLQEYAYQRANELSKASHEVSKCS